MKPEYKRDFVNSYMILPKQKEVREDNFQIKMITQGIVPGLLTCKIGNDERESYYYYEISGKNNLKKLYEHKKLSCLKLKNLFLQVRDIYNRCHEHLLEEECLILDPEFIYLDIREFVIALVPYPEHIGNRQKELEQFAEFLLEIIDYEDEPAVELAYAFYEYAQQENFTWSSFLQYILQSCEKEKLVVEEEIKEECQVVVDEKEDIKVEKPTSYLKIIIIVMILIAIISLPFLTYYALLFEISIFALILFFYWFLKRQPYLYLILEEDE